jgi:hypothetical protein
MNLPSFKVLEEGTDIILIRDESTMDGGPSVTNGAELVVSYLHNSGMLGTKRLFYIDTMGGCDELVHNGHGTFLTHKYGFPSEDLFRDNWPTIKRG